MTVKPPRHVGSISGGSGLIRGGPTYSDESRVVSVPHASAILHTYTPVSAPCGAAIVSVGEVAPVNRPPPAPFWIATPSCSHWYDSAPTPTACVAMTTCPVPAQGRVKRLSGCCVMSTPEGEKSNSSDKPWPHPSETEQ